MAERLRHGDFGDKTWGEVEKDSLVIKNMEVVGGTGISARLVVISQRVGCSALYMDIAPMKLEELRDVFNGLLKFKKLYQIKKCLEFIKNA